MRTIVKRWGALSLLVAFSFALVACGNKEADQRKAFTTFLQTRVLDKPGLRVPVPSPEQKASFGDYAQHYAVITDFNEGMNKSVGQPMTEIVNKGGLQSISDLVSRRADLQAAKDGLAGLRTALDQQTATADAAHAQLKQPDDLKQVYDKAYEKTVTVPSTTFKEVFPALATTFDSALAIGSYIEQNKSKIQISGSTVSVTDPAVQAELNKMLQQLNSQSSAIRAAQQRVLTMVRGA